MKKSITYKSVPVKNVSLRFLKNIGKRSPVHVGIDIGKRKLLVSVRWSPSRSRAVVYENPWLAENTNEIPALIAKLRKIHSHTKLIVGIESTGTYGDPLRQALHDAGITVHQVRTKHTHDYAEIFDGVPSQHDGKDAAVIADLVSHGKSKPWNYAEQTEAESEIRYQTNKMIDIHKEIEPLRGKLEGLLARFWPQSTTLLAFKSLTILKLLKHYGGPSEIVKDKEFQAIVRKFSRGRIDETKSKAIQQDAKTTAGVRQGVWDLQACKDLATKMLDLHKQSAVCKKRLKELIEQSNVRLQRLATVLGVGTASIVWCRIGDPARYHCADAWIKAMGLNLTERSSGEYQSEYHISKRGDSQTRRWLYVASLRWVQKSPVKEWYHRKKMNTGRKISGDPGKVTGGKAIVAVTRKLMKGLWFALMRDVPFDPRKLFFKEGSRRKDATSGCGALRKRKKSTNKRQMAS